MRHPRSYCGPNRSRFRGCLFKCSVAPTKAASTEGPIWMLLIISHLPMAAALLRPSTFLSAVRPITLERGTPRIYSVRNRIRSRMAHPYIPTLRAAYPCDFVLCKGGNSFLAAA